MSSEIVCGWHAVQAAIERRPGQVETVWLSGRREDKRVAAVELAARSAGIPVERVSPDELDELAEGVRHQGVVARVRQRATATGEHDLLALLKSAPTPLLLVLDGVQDPHNLGACLRSAAAAGALAVIVPRDNSAPLTPVARRAAAGAAETLPLATVTNLARTLRDLKEVGVWIYGASHDAEATIYETDLSGPIALVLGGEGKGLRRLTREHCDGLFRIPMSGAVESLNVSVAAGISLFEAVRQRLAKPAGKSKG
jgi:23S rRNA (guanosine2251-2'-O)-methyltransferase